MTACKIQVYCFRAESLTCIMWHTCRGTKIFVPLCSHFKVVLRPWCQVAERVVGFTVHSSTKAGTPEAGADIDKVQDGCCVVRSLPLERDLFFIEGRDFGISRRQEYLKKGGERKWGSKLSVHFAVKGFHQQQLTNVFTYFKKLSLCFTFH